MDWSTTTDIEKGGWRPTVKFYEVHCGHSPTSTIHEKIYMPIEANVVDICLSCISVPSICLGPVPEIKDFLLAISWIRIKIDLGNPIYCASQTSCSFTMPSATSLHSLTTASGVSAATSSMLTPPWELPLNTGPWNDLSIVIVKYCSLLEHLFSQTNTWLQILPFFPVCSVNNLSPIVCKETAFASSGEKKLSHSSFEATFKCSFSSTTS